ncbi:alpha-amylase family glycosyl hydrolase [Marinimicrobium agarilyticum]|uniref:alpha-amylase family glycosyl hydrolase n=1 Tax=Marinimicrobium agarilyticum TaxID=306546 RepID=UPI00040FA380|nr:alpha-amylase family glycosyl hydrolase [Marinimicrobium agarilyticum]
MNLTNQRLAIAGSALLLTACASQPDSSTRAHYYGTQEAFAEEAIYFLLTDRFVDGDPSNNHGNQGGEFPTFDRPMKGPDGKEANVGYMGGDFKGILDNADYLADLGVTALWISPIVDNPNQAFSGGDPVGFAQPGDGGKTGFHGYWGTNFYQVDEHWESQGLTFADLTRRLREEHDMKVVLDIVANHSSPSYSMPEDQPMFGEVYGPNGELVADHENLPPEELNPNNPLHAFYEREKDLAQLGKFDDANPRVMDYVVDAYLQWIEQGAAAFRIDTLRHKPHAFWKAFTDRIRAEHPDFFMFGESFVFDAEFLGQHTLPEHGGVSVLDFPAQKTLTKVFENPQSDYAEILSYLHLENSPYHNPYELVSFYENHDIRRMDGDTKAYINANNWLFTARGIPSIYYGSEIGFMPGTKEHEGNRNFFGESGIAKARNSEIAKNLKQIAHIRQDSVALQKGLQANLEFDGQTASFLRVYQDDHQAQTALVLLNKGDDEASLTVDRWLNSGEWYDAHTGERYDVDTSLTLGVPENGVRVLLFDGVVNNEALARRLDKLQAF